MLLAYDSFLWEESLRSEPALAVFVSRLEEVRPRVEEAICWFEEPRFPLTWPPIAAEERFFDCPTVVKTTALLFGLRGDRLDF